MINNYKFLIDLFVDIYIWKSSNSMNSKPSLLQIKADHNSLWRKIIDKKKSIVKRKKLSDIDKEFLDCFYIGNCYRIMGYCKNKGNVYPMRYFRSCSTDRNFLLNNYIYGKYIIVCLKYNDEDNAIDYNKLILFMKKYNLYKEEDDRFFNKFFIDNLIQKYFYESEIVGCLKKNNVKDIVILDAKTKETKSIENELWFRKKY